MSKETTDLNSKRNALCGIFRSALLTKYRAPSIVVLCLIMVLVVYQNCGGDGGGTGGNTATIASSVQIDPKDLQNIVGQYFLPIDQSRIAYLQIDEKNVSVEFQKILGTHALFQENEGSISIIGKNEFKIVYSNESCNPIGDEIVTMKNGNAIGTLDVTTISGKKYIFYNTSTYRPPTWATTATVKDEDLSCSVQFFKTTLTSKTIKVAANQIQCKNGTRKETYSQFYAALLSSRSLINGILPGDTEPTVYLGYSYFGDIIGVSKVINDSAEIVGYNVEVSFCIDSSNINTPPYFENRNIIGISTLSDIALTDNPDGTGSLHLSNAQITVESYSGIQSYPQASFIRTFDTPSNVNSIPLVPTPVPTAAPTPLVDTGCEAPGTGNQPFDYYTLPSIVAHGKSSNVVAWSSATDPRLQTPTAQNMFVTDARFQIRVLAKPSPGKAIDTYNHVCTMEALPYTRLQVKIGVKLPGAATYFATHTFDASDNSKIAVGGCSPAYSFSMPPHSGPVVVEIMNVKWDYSCTWDMQMGVAESSSSYCPWGLVWINDCYELTLQVATDYTKGLP